MMPSEGMVLSLKSFPSTYSNMTPNVLDCQEFTRTLLGIYSDSTRTDEKGDLKIFWCCSEFTRTSLGQHSDSARNLLGQEFTVLGIYLDSIRTIRKFLAQLGIYQEFTRNLLGFCLEQVGDSKVLGKLCRQLIGTSLMDLIQ